MFFVPTLRPPGVHRFAYGASRVADAKFMRIALSPGCPMWPLSAPCSQIREWEYAEVFRLQITVKSRHPRKDARADRKKNLPRRRQRQPEFGHPVLISDIHALPSLRKNGPGVVKIAVFKIINSPPNPSVIAIKERRLERVTVIKHKLYYFQIFSIWRRLKCLPGDSSGFRETATVSEFD